MRSSQEGELVPTAPPRSSLQRAPSSSCGGRRSKYVAPPQPSVPNASRLAKTCPSGGFAAVIAAERAAAQRAAAAAEVNDSCAADWDDDRFPGSEEGADSMASTATSISEFPSQRGKLQPHRLKKGMMELAHRFCPSAVSIPRSLALSLRGRPSSASSALARLEWQPQNTSTVWPHVPRQSGMLARLENLRQQAIAIHRGIQKNKFSIQMVRESYSKIGQSVPALPPLDGEAPLPSHPRESMFFKKDEDAESKGPTVNIDIEINFTEERACDILGVEQDASHKDVRKAYHSLAKFAHPDKGGQTSEFQRLGEAYTFLQNK